MLRLGAVAYLNMQPLIHGLAESAGDELEIRQAPPSMLARWLATGEIDVGMVPVASLFEHPDWHIVPAPPGLAARASMIGSRGPVRSVLVVGGGPAENWTRLRLDGQSRTSNVLAQIILKNMHGLAPELLEPDPVLVDFVPHEPEMGSAQVLIGSRALEWIGEFGGMSRGTAERSTWQWLDLGEQWTNWTQLPAVYALWATRPGVQAGEWGMRLEAQKCANLARIPVVAGAWPRLAEENLTMNTAVDYLTRSIDYDFDAAAQAGLERYYSEGCALGLFKPGWKLEWAE